MHSVPLRAVLALLVFAPIVRAAEVDGPDEEIMPDSLRTGPLAPTGTFNGTRGLSQTPAAEALGPGRLVIGLSGPWYRQERSFGGVPNRRADIITGVGTVAYGLAAALDVFASLTGYSSLNYRSDRATGLGTLGAGAQFTLPVTGAFPLRLAAQAGAFAGLSGNPINRNEADGYNYFETRTGADYRGMLIQSLVLGPERLGFKAHFNQGLSWSDRDAGSLMLLAAGLQANLGAAALGLELHSRTRTRDVALLDDPLWLTPSLQVRTGWNVNLTAGADFALSRDRDHSVAERSLEPWRAIGGIAFTLDTRWLRERDAKWAALKALRSRERAALAVMRRQAAQEAQEALEAEAEKQAEARRARESSREAMAAAAAQAAERERRARALNKGRALAAMPPRTPLENRLLAGETISLASVPFQPGRADIAPRAKPFLDDLAKVLTRYAKLRYELGGHADSVGHPEVNRLLSHERAVAVKFYLSEREPELEDRIGVIGYGAANPVADNASTTGRLMNRITDLKVANKAALADYVLPPSSPTNTAMGPEE